MLAVAVLDELSSGLPVTLLPRIRDELGLSYAQVGLLFLAGDLVAMVLAPLVGLAEGRPKRWPIAIGAAGLALGYALAAGAGGFVALSLAFAVAFVAGDLAVGLAQTALVDADAQDSQRALTRWTLAAGIGDLLAPALVALGLALGLGWRGLHLVAAGLWLGLAVWIARALRGLSSDAATDARSSDDDDHGDLPPFLTRIRLALRERELLRWVAISALCALPDEAFLAFAALYLTDVIGLAPHQVVLAIGGLMLGPMLALVLLERLGARVIAERHLPWFALATLFATAGFLGARTTLSAAAWLALVGASAATWYPLAKARCYAALPGRTATVAAVFSLTAPFQLAVPITAGLIAQAWGPGTAVAALGIGGALGVIALVPRRAGSVRRRVPP